MGQSVKSRVLGRVRLSRSTDESTSVERQRDVIQQWADSEGHTVVGWAVDEDVSGSIDPFETPQFGPWLSNPAKADEYDIIAAWKLDRLGRNARQLNKLFGWCLDNDKTLFTTSERLDLGNWTGQLLATVMAGLAEGELEAIRERQLASRQKLREVGRWSGGKAPYGYRSVRLEAGGWKLEIDPLSASVVRRIVDGVLDDVPTTRIARELNEEHYLAPGDYYRTVRAGTPTVVDTSGATFAGRPKRSKWSPTTIRQMLRSKALLGHAHHNGQSVRDDDGRPVLLAEPLITLDESDLIQAVLDRTLSRRTVNRSVRSPLLGVLVCYTCGSRLHHTQSHVKGKQYRYYRCPENKDAGHIPAEIVETHLEEVFLGAVGDLDVRERVWVPGDTREAELTEAVRAIDDLSQLMGSVSSQTAKQRIQRQIGALDLRVLELEQAPSEGARWEYVSTGETYRAVWGGADVEERRQLLLKSGITLAVRHHGFLEFNLLVPAAVGDTVGGDSIPTDNTRLHLPMEPGGTTYEAALSEVGLPEL